MNQIRSATFLFVGLLFAASPVLRADEKAPPAVKASFQIAGLHCAPCTATVERSLKSLKGVKNIKVDWATKIAKVEFDEHDVVAQKVASRIASTAHMMGGNMHYAGTLSIQVPKLATGETADKAKKVLSELKGVSKVVLDLNAKTVSVAFSTDGDVSTVQLLGALKDAGIEASLL